MNVGSIVGIIGVPFFIHAAFMFFQSIPRGFSQYDALQSINVEDLETSMLAKHIIGHKIHDEYICKDLFVAILFWANGLRKVGLIPIFIYLATLFIVFSEFFIKDIVNTKLAVNILLLTAFALQVIYIYLKIKSGMVSILVKCHSDYRNKSFLAIMLDIVPVWAR